MAASHDTIVSDYEDVYWKYDKWNGWWLFWSDEYQCWYVHHEPHEWDDVSQNEDGYHVQHAMPCETADNESILSQDDNGSQKPFHESR